MILLIFVQLLYEYILEFLYLNYNIMFLGYNKHHTMIRLLFGGSKKHNTYKLVILFRFYSFYKVDTQHNNIIHIGTYILYA